MKRSDVLREAYKQEWKVWVAINKPNISYTSDRTSLKVGDIVTYTNDYGVKFEGLEVLGFDNDAKDRFIYLNLDCYWSATTEKNVKIEK